VPLTTRTVAYADQDTPLTGEALTSSGGNALVSTPIEIRSGSHPSGDRPSAPSLATKRLHYHTTP
jgi:hypothetical protein